MLLSKAPGPSTLQAKTPDPTTDLDFKPKWKLWLEKSLKEASKHFRSAQERYKRNYDKRLRKKTVTIKLRVYVFFRTEKKDEKDSRHKLEPIPERPYVFKQTDDKSKTVVIEYADKNVKNGLRLRVVRTPRRKSPAKIQDVVPETIIDVTFVDYPITEAGNNSHAPVAEENYQPKVYETDVTRSDRTSDREEKL